MIKRNLKTKAHRRFWSDSDADVEKEATRPYSVWEFLMCAMHDDYWQWRYHRGTTPTYQVTDIMELYHRAGGE